MGGERSHHCATPAAFETIFAIGWTFKSYGIRTINRRPVSCIFNVTLLAGDVKKNPRTSVVVKSSFIYHIMHGLGRWARSSMNRGRQ